MTSCWQLGWMPVAGAESAKDATGEQTVTADLQYDDNVLEKDSESITNGAYGVNANTVNHINDTGTPYTVTYNNNGVILNNAPVNGYVLGVYFVGNGNGSRNINYIFDGNTVTIDGATSITGPWYNRIEGAWMLSNGGNNAYKPTSLIMRNNGVTIDVDNSKTINSGFILGVEIGTADDALAENNYVNIKGGNFTNTNTNVHVIAGARPSDRADQSGSLRAIGNTVDISGGTFDHPILHIYGAGREADGFFHETSQNKVTITGGTFKNNVTITGGGAGHGDKIANDNVISISGGDFSAVTSLDITGGEGKTTNNNTVNLLTSLALNSLTGGTGTTSTGNTLNVGATGITTKALAGFQNMNFYLPTTTTAGDTMLTINSNLNSERYHFDTVNSHRIQLGFRYTHALNEKSSLYGGLAWQYKFDGEARASYNGMSTPSPSLKGSSGMAEIGWQIKPSQAPLTLDLGVNGWVGKQKGVVGSLKVNWEF